MKTKIHNTGGSITKGDHRKSHAKTWYCGEGKGSQLQGSKHTRKVMFALLKSVTLLFIRQPRAQTQAPQKPRRTWVGANGRFAREIRRNPPQEPRGTWYGVTTGTRAQHYHVARETGNRARGRGENPIWQREPVVESRRRLRDGGSERKCFALEPSGTGPYSTKRKEGDRSGYASKGGAPCRKKTGKYTRRTVDDDQSKTGGDEAEKTQGEDIRHSQDDESQRVTCSSTKVK